MFKKFSSVKYLVLFFFVAALFVTMIAGTARVFSLEADALPAYYKETDLTVSFSPKVHSTAGNESLNRFSTTTGVVLRNTHPSFTDNEIHAVDPCTNMIFPSVDFAQRLQKNFAAPMSDNQPYPTDELSAECEDVQHPAVENAVEADLEFEQDATNEEMTEGEPEPTDPETPQVLPWNDAPYRGEFMGRFKIPDVGADVACYYGCSQSITDQSDSAAMFHHRKHVVIADHKNQGFDAIKSCTVGTKAYISGIYYTCVAITNGFNRAGLEGPNYESIAGMYPDTLVCYTCNENSTNITLVFFQPDA